MGDQEENNKRKSLRISRGGAKRLCCCYNLQDDDEANSKLLLNHQLLSLPTEVLLEILSYLSSQDFYTLRKVSKYFYRLEPLVWKVYQVEGVEPETSEVIQQLKHLPHLNEMSIEARSDCDQILHQLSRSNKRLEILNIKNCQLYLRSCNLTRILEHCSCLHTLNIVGSRFRSKKFYCLLGNMVSRMQTIVSTATCSQFRAFVKHAANQLNEYDRANMCAMCTDDKKITWSPLHYFLITKKAAAAKSNHFNKNSTTTTTTSKEQQQRRALVSYLYNDFISINVANECTLVLSTTMTPSTTHQ